ncbi:ATP-binding protein [Peribacillus sp. FSL K6-1552]|uniref:sensor histidine kinase n=1 Tax=Peribacillus sp. FSL K6-1552 TaxID=2954514 RepID=UPI0030F5717B
MNFFKSIGWRMTIWHSIMFMVGLFLFCVFLTFTFSDMLTKKVDSMLARELSLITYCLEKRDSFAEIEQHINGLPSFAGVNTEEIYWHIENGRGEIIARSHNLHGKRIKRSNVLDRKDENFSVWDTEFNRTPIRAMSMNSKEKEKYQVTVATYSRMLNVSILNLKHILFFLTLYFVGFSVIMGWLISKKTLQPINQIISTANQISAKRLNERLPIEGPEDELYSLCLTLNRMIDRLEVSFTQVQQFTSDVSHELRTSLTIIRGELDVALNRRRTEEEYKRVIHTVLEEVIYLSDMAEKFLYLSRETSTSNQIKRKTVDGVFLLQYVRNHLQSMVIKKQIKLNIHENEPFTLYGDEDLLRRLFINLMENAIKYTPEGGTVEIKACNKKEFIYIEVIDHGIGIPKEHLPFIFQRFYRVDDSRSRSQGGTGLGLSLCKWIVEAHKGTIEVRSKPDEGTRVIVKLHAG